MSSMAVGDRMEHMQLEEMMKSLGLMDMDMVEVEEVGPWEVEEDWLVQWLTMQDRLGLGPDNGDVCMKEVPDRGCEMILEVEWGMEMSEVDNNYMEWLESELMEMDVDTNTINRVMYNEQSELQDIADIYDTDTQNTDISSKDIKETDQVTDITGTEWSTGRGGLLFLMEGDTQEELGPTKRRRLSGRVEEIVLRMEGGAGEVGLLPKTIQTDITLQSESRRGKGGGGGGRNVRQLVGRFGEQSKITSYFGGGVGSGQKFVKKVSQNLGSERGPLQHAGVKRKADECTVGSVGSEKKKVRW